MRSPNEIKRSFLLKSAVWFGLGLGVAPILFCGKFDDIGFMFFTLVSSVCVGLLWGLIMWQDISSNNPRLQDITADHQKASDQAADVTHFVFDARYDEYGVGQAERSFFVRSLKELRPLSTFTPPLVFAAFVVAGLAFDIPWLPTGWLSGFFALSILLPILMYFARPAAAKRLAVKYPVRPITLTSKAFEITSGDQKRVIPWTRIQYVWNAGDYLILVANSFMNIKVPRASLPQGAYEFILASVKGGNITMQA